MSNHPRTDNEEEQTPSKKGGIWSQILVSLLIAACSGSLGYGYSQSTTGREVAVSMARLTLSVDHIKELQSADRKVLDDSDQRTQRDISEIRAASTEHMKTTVALIQKMVEQNQELIAFLKAFATGNKP